MNGASKILTVSYGTFSCTLEGFDDPFNTMKVIAEYFRDLAAEDRYFGAEPPTPDAAMLHKIAEREIQRRVEAKIADNSVILRAEVGVTPKVTFPATPVAPAAPSLAPAAAQPIPASAPATPILSTPVLSTPAEAAPAIESAAARLSRLRAAQAHAAPTHAPSVVTFAPAEPPAAVYYDIQDDEDAPAEAASAPVAFPEIAMQDADETAEDRRAAKEARRARKAQERAAEPLAASAVDTVIVETATEAPTKATADQTDAAHVAAAPTDDALLASLSRLADGPADVAVDIAKDNSDAAAALELDSLTSSIRETLAGLGGADEAVAVTLADLTVEADLSLIGDADQDDAFAVEEVETDQAEPETDLDFSDADQPADQPYDAFEADEAVPAPDMAAPDEDARPDEAIVPEDSAAAPEPAFDAGKSAPEIAISAPVVAEKIQRARARVIKIRRLDTSAPEADAAPQQAPADTQAALTAEAEAALQHELAALEAELSTPAAPEEDVAPVMAERVIPTRVTRLNTELDAIAAEIAPQRPAPVAEPHRLPAAETDDASVNRLLEKANTELEVPETKRRRSAIAHLKAAVLATVAERRSNPNKAPDTRMDPYRKDLDHVVRPMPSDRPAPLVLVSSQRIDRHPEAPTTSAQPVRPRRVATRLNTQMMPVDMSEDDDVEMEQVYIDPSKQSFQEFAEALGAHSMQDLIEAAGAYCTIVLGHDSFTRPFLFQQIGTLPGQSDASREDSLRGFGRLLRDGRLTKTKRGQYALSDTSPMLSEAKRQVG